MKVHLISLDKQASKVKVDVHKQQYKAYKSMESLKNTSKISL
jgi:hypothetical protein